MFRMLAKAPNTQQQEQHKLDKNNSQLIMDACKCSKNAREGPRMLM